jgi:DnaA family protein
MVVAGRLARVSEFAQLPLGLALRERMTFDSFVPGANAEVLQALRRCAQGAPGILWLHGAAASGRTHLLQATCAACDPQRRVAYVPLRSFGGSEAEALASWSGFDCLCVDDVDRAIGGLAAERALFTLHRDAEERRAVLIVAAAAPPSQLQWALPDIASRFAAAQVFRLRDLDDEGQAQVLRQRAASRGFELPEETRIYLQRRFPRNLAVLCELLDTLDLAALSAQRRLTVPFIRQVLDRA